MEFDRVEIMDVLRRSGCLDMEDVARDRSRTSVVGAAVDGFLNARACREVMRTVADVDDIVLDIAIPIRKAARISPPVIVTALPVTWPLPLV